MLLMLAAAYPALADSPKTEHSLSDGFVYTVQPGDTLILVALKHNLKITELALANDLSLFSLVYPGQRLILPGVTVPQPTPEPQPAPDSHLLHVVQSGESIFTIATYYGLSEAELIEFNGLADPDLIQAGQELKIPVPALPTPAPMQPPFESVGLSEPAIIQGRTLVVSVKLSEPATLTGSLEIQPVAFHQSGNNQFWGVVAIHALAEPDIYPLTIQATLPTGEVVEHTENIQVIEGPYSSETIWVDSSRAELLKPEIIQEEREKLISIWSQITPQPLWSGPFGYPVDDVSPRITSNFGTRRAYNDSTALSFHGGTDFGGGVGTPIYAPAAGKVVLAEPLVVRGNAVLIDHGMGLYSGYWHQSEIVVTEGQEIEAGDLIGYVGDTGLVTGPHLHWEFRLNGIAVEPLQWIRESIP